MMINRQLFLVGSSVLLAAAFLIPASQAAMAAGPEDLPRMEICLNGAWETVVDAKGETIPVAGWSVRRAPALPLATDPRTASIWYRHRVRIPRTWVRPERRFLVRLEKVGHYAAVYWNGIRVAEHHGQYTPFEADVTSGLRPGEENEIAVFVHSAMGKYARPGVDIAEAFEGNAYRGAQMDEPHRNWVGVVGDIFLVWRPATALSDVFVIPSVRRHQLAARIETSGERARQPPLIVRADVLDGGKVVRSLGEARVRAGETTLEADWRDPILWGPPPGSPKLYVLRTELVRNKKVVDRRFTRFGFREVWVQGRDLLLNGKKAWMTGTFFHKLVPIYYLNDRRPQALMMDIMQASGMNASHGHWDDLGRSWLDRCDEAGILVMAGFYCDGRPRIHSRADAGWSDWITATASAWARSVRHHPSIVLWRPIDVLPENLHRDGAKTASRLAAEVRRQDGTRPLADGSDIDAWVQSAMREPKREQPDDGSAMAAHLGALTKPFLVKEIVTGDTARVAELRQFFDVFYKKEHAGDGIGLLVQALPIIEEQTGARIGWLSESGPGNRDREATFPKIAGVNLLLPNWSDPAYPAWVPSPYSTLFAELQAKYVGYKPSVSAHDDPSELLVSGLAADETVFLAPPDPALAEATGTRAAADGTAWITAERPGPYRIIDGKGSFPIEARPQPRAGRKPGYDYVQRVTAPPTRVPGR